jgi:hypothetical protein
MNSHNLYQNFVKRMAFGQSFKISKLNQRSVRKGQTDAEAGELFSPSSSKKALLLFFIWRFIS